MQKNIFLYIAVAVSILFIIGIGYTQLLKPQLDNRTVSETVRMPITSPEVGLTFTYPSGQDALALIEPPIDDAQSPVSEVYILMQNDEYNKYTNENGGTPPPTISVFVLPYIEPADVEGLSRTERLVKWATLNPAFSSYGVATSEPEETEIDGSRAIKYQTKSVYNQTVYLTMYDKNIYIFTGQYREENDILRELFTGVIDSVILD